MEQRNNEGPFGEDFDGVPMDSMNEDYNYDMLDVFATDLNLDEVDRTVKYLDSDLSVQRLVHMQRLGEVCLENNFEDVSKKILPLFAKLVCEQETCIRQEFASQLPKVAECCSIPLDDAGYASYMDFVIPTLKELCKDTSNEVKDKAIEVFADTCEYIKKEERPSIILSYILELAHSNSEDNIILAVNLFKASLHILGIDLCIQFVCPEVVALAEDLHFTVRKTAILCLGDIAVYIGVETTEEKILPVFLKNVKDSIWSVRRTCAEIVPQLAESLSLEKRCTVLSAVVCGLARDDCVWVKKTMLQSLGKFICLIPSASISDDLLTIYQQLADDSEVSGDCCYALACAYTFPAVLKALGRDLWYVVEGTYSKLVKHDNINVRKTLAYSLHEIAHILKDNSNSTSLCATLELFLKDCDEVKMGAVKHLADFWRELSNRNGIAEMEILKSVFNESLDSNWRFRVALANQMNDFIVIFPPELVYNPLMGMIDTLLRDPTAVVRTSTIPCLKSLFSCLSHYKNDYFINSIKKFLEFYKSDKYLIREVFARGLFELLTVISDSLYANYIHDSVLLCLKDPVVNIRITYANCWLLNKDERVLHFLNNQEYVNILLNDSNTEIRNIAKLFIKQETPEEDKEPEIQIEEQKEDEIKDTTLSDIVELIDGMFPSIQTPEDHKILEEKASLILHAIVQFIDAKNKQEFTNGFMELFGEDSHESMMKDLQMLFEKYIPSINHKNLYTEILCIKQQYDKKQ
ncbi:hypothetical protein WA158_005645 [Blastocystis sp. Blastoise]